MTSPDIGYRRRRRHRNVVLYRIAMFLPPAVTVASVLYLGIHCWQLLDGAAAGRVTETATLPALLALTGVLLGAAATILVQGVSLSRRVVEPGNRVIAALRRIRESGDIGFRIHVRRGDLLTEVAAEVNELLEWLNQHPPASVNRRGSDVVEVESVELAELEQGAVAHE